MILTKSVAESVVHFFGMPCSAIMSTTTLKSGDLRSPSKIRTFWSSHDLRKVFLSSLTLRLRNSLSESQEFFSLFVVFFWRVFLGFSPYYLWLWEPSQVKLFAVVTMTFHSIAVEKLINYFLASICFHFEYAKVPVNTSWL